MTAMCLVSLDLQVNSLKLVQTRSGALPRLRGETGCEKIEPSSPTLFSLYNLLRISLSVPSLPTAAGWEDRIPVPNLSQTYFASFRQRIMDGISLEENG